MHLKSILMFDCLQIQQQGMSQRGDSQQAQAILHHDDDLKNTEEQQTNYFNEYCRLYLANQILSTQLKELNIEKSDLVVKLARLQKRAEELSEGNSGQVDEKKRRIRRSAGDIARHYKCQIEGCTKSYGSEGSLNQHIKLKHPQIFRGHEKDYTVKEYDNQDDDSP